MENIEKTISEMSLDEKITLCTGADFWHSKAMPEHGIEPITMSDGPHGVRFQSGETDMIGVNESAPATCFPTAVTAGATWNPELYEEEGKAIGDEGLSLGVDVVLGPGCNIKRNPLCGRNFEYISEDPYVAGEMAAAFISGQQKSGASSSLKHFAVNNQEYKRQNGDSQVDDRALREIYLSGFETAVKKGRPDTVMCSYNKINGVHASDNKWLLTDVLRDEWGFDGMVVTDWGAMSDRIAGFTAGCDLNMPGGSKYMEKKAADAVKNKTLSEEYIDKSVKRIISLSSIKREKGKPADSDAHHLLARKIAEEGAVLLKNDNNVLPVKEEDIVLIGNMAKDFRYQGAGSSHINPTKLVSVVDAMPEVPFVCCGDRDGKVTDEEINLAVKAASSDKTAVIIAGLPESYESEGFDRENMSMPDGYNRLIEAVAAENQKTIVVLLGGSVMELPWTDKVSAVLFMGLSGQAGGEAVRRLLTGEANPSGKLTESWPVSYADVISKTTFGKKNTEYRESIYVGYRYYDKVKKEVRYPFGHGLSYTSFDYSDIKVSGKTVSAKITNTGAVKGAEVVQLYISAYASPVHRPEKELKGFKKVELESGETKEVSFELSDRSFAIWNDGWKTYEGKYIVMLASSSRDIRLASEISVDGEKAEKNTKLDGTWYDTLCGEPSREEWEKCMGHEVPLIPEPKKGQFTMDSTCLEMKDSSFMMKIQYKATEAVIAKSFGGKKDYSDPAFKMMMVCATDCPMRSVVISAGGIMSDGFGEGMVDIANGHFFKGIGKMLGK